MKRFIVILFVAALLVFCVGLAYFSLHGNKGVEFEAEAENNEMPSVFEEFAETWNSQVAEWLAQEKSRVEGELQKWRSSSIPGASATLAMHERELEILLKRIALGDVVREKSVVDLPPDLMWEDGSHEPDMGDSRAVKGGEITLWNAAPFPTTVREFGPGSLNYFNHSLYDSVSLGLVELHQETGRPIPGVACSWAVSDDGKTVFYKLDSRARYSNGQMVRARDFLLGMCLRVSDFSRDPYWISRYRETLAAVSTYGDSIISVTLPYPVTLIPYMAARELHAASPAFYQKFDPSFPQKFQWKAAPTTGGYTVVSRDIHFGRSIAMSRVENWWAKDLKFYRNSCNVDKIEHRFIGEESIALELFRLGEIDAITVRKPDVWNGKFESPGFLGGFIERVVLKNEYPCPTYGIYLNTASFRLDDLDVRRGIFHALNMNEAIRTVFRGSFSQLRSFADGYGDLTKPFTPVPYSPEKARECFARAGFDRSGNDGILMDAEGRRLSFALTYASLSPLMTSICQHLRQYAKACGVDIRIDGLDSSTCARKVFEKRYEMVLWAEPASSPFPELYRTFHSSLARDEKGRLLTHTANLCSLADEQLDSLLMEERHAKTREELKKSLHAVQSRLDDLHAWVPGWKENGVRTAFWGWVCWPESKETDFCPVIIDDPLESHLYWIDSRKKQKILEAKKSEPMIPVGERAAGNRGVRANLE